MSMIYLLASMLAVWLGCAGWFIYLVHHDSGEFCKCKPGHCEKEDKCRE